MSAFIEPAESPGAAWLRTVEWVSKAGGYAINVMTTATHPLAPEEQAIRDAVDAILVEGHRPGTRVQTVDTVAGTIFPVDLYLDPRIPYEPGMDATDKARLDAAAADLYAAYADMLPILTTEQINSRGTYFGRMVSWPGKTGGGFNQLAERVNTLRNARDHNHRKRNLEDIAVGGEGEGLMRPDVLLDASLDEAAVCAGDAASADGVEIAAAPSPPGVQVYAANDRRPRGFPCLVHIDLTVFDGRLSMAAVYRHQYLITKAYGNLLGLSRLLGFLAQQSGYEVGELVVHATMADLEQDTYGKRSVEGLIDGGPQRDAGMTQLLVRVGVDMVSLPALAALIETSGAGFVDACWTGDEQRYCNGSLERLAARWAAKEATMKAIGHGIGEIDPLDIEVIAAEGEPPELRLQGGALTHAERAGLGRFALSLCHEGELAIAYVLAHNAPVLDASGGIYAS